MPENPQITVGDNYYTRNWLAHLQTEDRIWRRLSFDRVTITGRSDRHGQVAVSLLGTCYSEYESGPSLLHLANVAGQFFGPGFYGLESCRALNQPWLTPDLAQSRGLRHLTF